MLGAETYGFAGSFDAVFTLQDELKRISHSRNPIVMLTDSAFFFQVLIRSSCTPEKHLMIDLSATWDAYDSGEIDDIGWIRTKDNITDAFTKTCRHDGLERFLDTSTLLQRISQWLIREPTKPNLDHKSLNSLAL